MKGALVEREREKTNENQMIPGLSLGIGIKKILQLGCRALAKKDADAGSIPDESLRFDQQIEKTGFCRKLLLSNSSQKRIGSTHHFIKSTFSLNF